MQTKAKEDLSPHEMRISPTEHQQYFRVLGKLLLLLLSSSMLSPFVLFLIEQGRGTSFIYSFIYLFIYVCIYLFICLFMLFIYLFVYLSIYLFIYYLFIK